jgi:peptidoglycan hydrolase-like protein with peptidoglycan-binding domain
VDRLATSRLSKASRVRVPVMPRRFVPRRSLTVVAGLSALAFALTACSSGVAAPAAIDAAPVLVEGAASAPSAGPSPTEAPVSPEPSPSAEPSPTVSAAPPAPSFDVAAAQRTLADLGYYLGAADGRRGPALRSAVMAFQKVQGLGADGVVGPRTLQALAAPKPAVLKASGPANRVEVDLTRQVLHVVKGGSLVRTLPISSGNGATYSQKDGTKARALTPTGWYKIQRRIVGVRKADLGTLYDPQYFYRGWAIHGSNSVPAYPASHGCVRVTRADGKWLLDAITIGMSVYLYGGTHTFTAGSAAPGTDTPTGDTSGSTSGEAAPGTPSPAAGSAEPSSAATTSHPPSAPASPAASPSPAAPSPSPSPTASATASPPVG